MITLLFYIIVRVKIIWGPKGNHIIYINFLFPRKKERWQNQACSLVRASFEKKETQKTVILGIQYMFILTELFYIYVSSSDVKLYQFLVFGKKE